MIQVLLIFWIITTLMVLREEKIARIIIYLGILSLTASLCYLILGSPDVAMAEAATSAFTVIFFIICFEKYFDAGDVRNAASAVKEKLYLLKVIIPIAFTVITAYLFISSIPADTYNTYLRDRYLASFTWDVGGENPVTSIYLGYRVYDTLFEALIVVLAVVAAVHLSAFGDGGGKTDQHSEMEKSGMAVFAIQIICPVMLLYGVYLIFNGHITPGGGFQGGLAIASFFICRYMIYDINDLPIKKLNKMEEIVFVVITLFAISIIFLGAAAYLPPNLRGIFNTVYMMLMNGLIGLKVACGFIILFYRYIVMEQK